MSMLVSTVSNSGSLSAVASASDGAFAVARSIIGDGGGVGGIVKDVRSRSAVGPMMISIGGFGVVVDETVGSDDGGSSGVGSEPSITRIDSHWTGLVG